MASQIMSTDGFIGRQIGDYTIQHRIGRGGMAFVYQAHQKSVDRYVALKIILLQDDNDANFKRRFAQEARLAASLEHLHILPVYGYGFVENEFAYIAMRLMRGGTLNTWVNQTDRNIDRAADIFLQIASALAYAHSQGVIHRDLKPSNLMFDHADNAFLADFGLAKLVESSQGFTQSGNIVGTPAYISPEQLRGDPIDHRADIYSMGILLYHMLTGITPFETAGSTVASIIYAHLEKPPAPARTIRPEISHEVDQVILKALAKDPADRYPNMLEMANALNVALGRSGTLNFAKDVLVTDVREKADLLASDAEMNPLTELGKIKTDDLKPLSQDVSNTTKADGFGTTILQIRDEPRKNNRWGSAALLAVSFTGLTIAILAFISLLSLRREMLENDATQTAESMFMNTSSILTSPIQVLAGVNGSSEAYVPSPQEIASASHYFDETGGFLALVTCTQETEYHAVQTREIVELAEEYGLPIRIYDSDGDRYREVTQIERARAEGAKAFIICPLDFELLTSTLESLQAVDTPLVQLASGVPTYGGVVIAGDDYQMGYVAGHAGGEIFTSETDQPARALILDYPTIPLLVNRARGLQEGFLSLIPDVEFVGSAPGGTRENGYEAVQSFLEQGEDFNVILSINDAGAFGAIDALNDAEIDPSSVMIFSVDAENLARQYIRDGYYMRASVEINRQQFSIAAVNVMVKLLAGSSVAEVVIVPPGLAINENYLRQSDLQTETPVPTETTFNRNLNITTLF